MFAISIVCLFVLGALLRHVCARVQMSCGSSTASWHVAMRSSFAGHHHVCAQSRCCQPGSCSISSRLEGSQLFCKRYWPAPKYMKAGSNVVECGIMLAQRNHPACAISAVIANVARALQHTINMRHVQAGDIEQQPTSPAQPAHSLHFSPWPFAFMAVHSNVNFMYSAGLWVLFGIALFVLVVTTNSTPLLNCLRLAGIAAFIAHIFAYLTFKISAISCSGALSCICHAWRHDGCAGWSKNVSKRFKVQHTNMLCHGSTVDMLQPDSVCSIYLCAQIMNISLTKRWTPAFGGSRAQSEHCGFVWGCPSCLAWRES